MICKKCGNKIEEGQQFCTICGRKVKNEIEEGKNTINKKETIIIKFNHLVIGIIITIMVLLCIIGASIYNNSNNTNNDTSNIIGDNHSENTGEVEQHKIYITQDSEVSPTEKEFIGVFSENLTEIYDKNQIDNSGGGSLKTCFYNTSVDNMLQYSSEMRLRNNLTGERDKVYETVYYYNSKNNNIIGSRRTIYAYNYYANALKEYFDTNIQDASMTFINASLNVFTNYHNMSEEERSSTESIEKRQEYLNFAENIINEENKTITFDNYVCSYNFLSVDFLFVSTSFKDDNNKQEILLLAYDEDTNPEDIIKEWYTTVSTQDIISENTEEINDLQEKSEISNEQDLNAQDNNVEEDNTNTVSIYSNTVENMNEQELYNFLTSNGLKYQVEEKRENVVYLDEKAGTSSTAILNYGNFEVGDIVNIVKTTYIPTNWNTSIQFTDLVDTSIQYNGGICTFSRYSAGDYTGFLENPEGKDIYYVPMGALYYINDNLVENYGKYTFTNEENVTIKIVVPYLYNYNEARVIATNVTIYSKTINLRETYINGSQVLNIDLPSKYD